MPSTSTLVLIALIIGIPMALFSIAFIVGCFEKHPVRMFNSSGPFEFPPYMRAMLLAARSLGFEIAGHGAHVKYGDKLRGLLLRSTDGYVMALIGEGTIMGMTMKKTLLFSQFENDRVLLTVDEAGTAELDENTTRQILMNANFDELVRRHYEKGGTMNGALPYPPQAGWKEIDDMYRQRCDRIVARGLAGYIDLSRETFRYSPAGAFRATIVHGIKQVLKPSSHVRSLKSRPRA